MKPLNTHVLLEIDKPKNKTKGGLLLSESEQKLDVGVVLEVGEGTDEYQMKLKKGDKVKYHTNAGTKIDYCGKLCILISELQCIAIV